MRIQLPYPPFTVAPTTMPSDAAYIGVPVGAARSMPSCMNTAGNPRGGAFRPGRGARPIAMPRDVETLIAEPLPLTPLAGRSGPPIGARLPIDLDGGGWSNGAARMPKADETVTASRGRRIAGAVAASAFASQKRSTPPGGRKRWMATGPLARVTSSAHRPRAPPVGAPRA